MDEGSSLQFHDLEAMKAYRMYSPYQVGRTLRNQGIIEGDQCARGGLEHKKLNVRGPNKQLMYEAPARADLPEMAS